MSGSMCPVGNVLRGMCPTVLARLVFVTGRVHQFYPHGPHNLFCPESIKKKSNVWQDRAHVLFKAWAIICAQSRRWSRHSAGAGASTAHVRSVRAATPASLTPVPWRAVARSESGGTTPAPAVIKGFIMLHWLEVIKHGGVKDVWEYAAEVEKDNGKWSLETC